MSGLPAPRLQLRWQKRDGDRLWQWECHYELVLPLDEYDIRGEICDEEGRVIERKRELVVSIKEPSLRGSNHEPCTSARGERYFDAPFRDGAHASWDAKVLGDPPIYVIAPDGATFTEPARATGVQS